MRSVMTVARIRLAHALPSVADDDSRDVGVLKQAGLRSPNVIG